MSKPSVLDEDVMERLARPFPEGEVKFKPGAQGNGKALAMAFISARAVMSRLDEVVGPHNWSFDFDMLAPDGKKVKGKLTVCGVTKCDAGEASPEDEPLKSAVSDAMKRAAVHFGIGRYLYAAEPQWVPYDAQKRRFIDTPRIPGMSGGQSSRPLPAAGNGARPAGAPATAGAAGAPRANTSSPSSPGSQRAQDAVRNAERPAPPVEAPPPPMDEPPAPGLFDEGGSGAGPCCAVCLTPVDDRVKAFSSQKFGRILCRDHQREAGSGAPSRYGQA